VDAVNHSTRGRFALSVNAAESWPRAGLFVLCELVIVLVQGPERSYF